MKLSLATALASAVCIGTYVWQDGISRCNDGDRYTSGKAQPTPFHRRFCGWNEGFLQVCTYASLFLLGMAMGEWWKAVLLLMLPGGWFIARHPTCTDAVTMALAWGASLLLPEHPYVAIGLSLASGFIHERGPVFAALYAWNPVLLIGLCAVGWWRTPAKQDHDKLVGVGFWGAIKAHKPYVNLLEGRLLWYGYRMVGVLACAWMTSVRAWAAVAVAFGSRILGTDTCRYLFWAAPAAIVATDVPAWAVVPAVGIHLATFRKAI